MIDILYSCPVSSNYSFGLVALKEIEALSKKYNVHQIPPTGDTLMQDHVCSNSDYMDNTKSFHGWSHYSLQSIREANIRNIHSILERTSMHILDQKNILKEYFMTDDYTVKKAIKEYNECEHLIVPSTLVRDSMVRYGVDENKIHIIPHGVDTSKFKFNRIEHDGFRILYVGANSYRKNTHLLIKAFNKTDMKKECELHLVGSGCNILTDVKNNIYGSSFLNDDALISMYQSSDLLVLPSREDGFGLTVLEALSCGTPVLVSDMAGVKDLVSDKVGFVINMNENVLSNFLEYIIEDNPFDSNECRKVAKRNTWNKNLKKLLDLYDSMLRDEP